MTEQTAQRPLKQFRAGGIRVAIWQNEGVRNGQPILLHSVTLNKRYRDQNTGEWTDSNSFFPDDLPRLRLLLDKAYEHIMLRDGTAERNASEPNRGAATVA